MFKDVAELQIWLTIWVKHGQIQEMCHKVKYTTCMCVYKTWISYILLMKYEAPRNERMGMKPKIALRA